MTTMTSQPLPALPAWATSADEWDDTPQWRLVQHTVDVDGCKVALRAVQFTDGTIDESSLDVGTETVLDLDNPSTELRRFAAALLELADTYERKQA